MDGIMGILIFAIAIGSTIWKIGKKFDTETASQTADDNEKGCPFPYEEYEEEEEEYRPHQETGHPPHQEDVRIERMKMTEKARTILNLLTKPQPATAPKETIRQVKSTRPKNSVAQSLHSAQEARRAFIYSEIFKRKYE